MTQWVQHISGNGVKWKLWGTINQQKSEAWSVIEYMDEETCRTFRLPKSEYRLCEPPERWVDVTAKCDMINCGQYLGHHIGAECYAIFGDDGYVRDGYRLRKVLGRIHSGELAVPQWSFVVEKREP